MIRTYTLADLKRLEHKLTEPLDPEREAWEAGRFRFASHRGVVHRVPRITGGSFNSPVPTDLIYANKATYTSKNTFTAEAQINDTATNPIPLLQAGYYDQTYGPAKTIRLVARGQILTTTTGPTWTLFVRFDSLTGTLIAQAGASTGSTASLVASSVASLWELEFDLVLRVAGAGTSATFQSMGEWTSPSLTPTLIAAWGGNAPPGTVTGDSTIQHQIWVDAACGTSNAANGITLIQLLVMGLN